MKTQDITNGCCVTPPPPRGSLMTVTQQFRSAWCGVRQGRQSYAHLTDSPTVHDTHITDKKPGFQTPPYTQIVPFNSQCRVEV